MPTLEIGLWLLMVLPAAVFTFVQFTQFGTARVALQMIAMALFIGLSIIHAGGFEIATDTLTTMYNKNNMVIGTNSEHIVLIAGGENSTWLAWIFLSLSIFNITSLFREKVFNF